ncbi:MAG: 30S ribosome-binding factor RbfA [Leptospiraceae bacterium]|nr:30S ribosome-binding factor RbfA [Leptospiraceae bacterium]MDW7976860.1 30S ribosome-binding factor RbfA [Leptospiraceae bacterium]
MDPVRKRKIESLIQREVSEYIYQKIKKKDDRIAFVSVTRVELTEDFGFARIFFSLFSPNEKENQTTWNIINRYRKQMQSEISKQIRLRRTPKFEFFIDTSIKEGDRILELIEKKSSSEQKDNPDA